MTLFQSESIIYAIGDVHGMDKHLQKLHGEIFKHHESSHKKRPLAIVHLGDYVDRGKNSRGVIDTILALEAKARRLESLTVLSLRGNHEQMLLDALEGSDAKAMDMWLNNGGRATLRSYKRKGQDMEDVLYHFPMVHRRWLENLPSILHDEDRKLVFVHAGIDPSTFPNCDPQHYLWTRSMKFFDPTQWKGYPAIEGYQVVHGHTPTLGGDPEIAGRNTRINVDTGAVFGGPLTAAIIAEDLPLAFLKVK